MTATTPTANRPIKEFWYSGARAAIWQNQTKSGVMYNITVSRSYKDPTTDQWADTNSFSDSDLPALAKAVSDAHSWIIGHKQSAETKSGGLGQE